MKNSLRKTLITLLAVTLLVSGCSSAKTSKKSESSSRDKSDVKETYAASEEVAYNQGMRGNEGFYESLG